MTLAQLRSADPTTFEKIVRAHGGRMLNLARNILRQDDDAQDAVQEAFISIHKALPEFDGKSQLATWIHRVTINAALMRLRRRKSIKEVSVDDMLPRFGADGHRVESPRFWKLIPESEIEEEERKTIVREKISQLGEIYRDVLILRDIQGLDTRETAESLGITEAMVKTRLLRARQALRGMLEPHFRGGRL